MPRYIDAEKLEKHFEYCIAEAYNTNGVTEDFDIALKAVKNQPTADVAPVSHGRWETISDSDLSRTVMCSVCNKTFYFSKRGQLNIDTMPYCPWCGGKMDGGGVIEENIEAIIPDNHEVTEVCPNCDSEITMIWNVAEKGLKAFCPVCGNRLMLCSECPATTERGAACDYDSKTDTCNVTRLNFRHDIGR